MIVWFRIKKYALAAGLTIAALVAGYAKWRSDLRAAVTRRRLQDEVDAHDRITNADTGIGATDAERIKRLRDMADKLRD